MTEGPPTPESDADEGSPGPAEPGPSRPALPDNPFSTETVEYMAADELLGVRLRGGPITATRVPTGIAGPFLFRLHELVQSIAIRIVGGTPGRRGPLAEVPGAGLLAVTQVAFDRSVTFHFTLGEAEQTQISSTGEVSSITAEAVRLLADMFVNSARGDEEALYEQTRGLGERVGDNLERLVEVFVQRDVDSLWRFPTQPQAIALTTTRALRTKKMLEFEELPRPFEQIVRGYLYRVDAREHTFVLDPADEEEEKLTGTYPEHLREELRHAWDHEVLAQLRTTHYFLRRQLEPDRVEVELMEILEIIDS